MRTGEKLKPFVLLAVPVYAALKLSKHNVKNTVWDIKHAEIYSKMSEKSEKYLRFNYDISGLKITIFNFYKLLE